jgi:hypothetical protein
MLETQSIEGLIQEQIKSIVESRVNAVVADGRWMQDIESRIVQHVQDRITARFSNINTVPDLVNTVKTSVAQLLDQGHVPGLGEYVDDKKIAAAVDNSTQVMVQNTIDQLVVDSQWLTKIEQVINQAFVKKISSRLSEIDIDSLIRQQVDACVDRWYDRLRTKFETNGILDSATALQLTVKDGAVVAQNQLMSQDLLVHKDAEIKGTLVVDRLAVRGSVNIDNSSWNELAANIAETTMQHLNESWKQQLTQQVLDLAKTKGIEFKQVLIGGHPLVKDGELSSEITGSSLTRVGDLVNLTVKGETNVFDTLNVSNHRVGINTQHPDMALAVWDEEVAISLGKIAPKQAYIGTARDQSLVIGVNKSNNITIDNQGTTTITKLRVGQFRIGHATEVPGYAGNRGDLVFNSDPKPNQPFGWVCLGAYKWQPLKSA